jgi:hypothetical protein
MVKKWSLRILLGVVALVVLLLVAIQVVLWSPLPRQWVVSAIQQKLQLRVSADAFSTGWGGRTSLSGVTLGLPLADEAFLQTPKLSVEHTSLFALLIGRPTVVKSIEIQRPNLLVRQMADGRWNLQEVAELVGRAGGGKTAEGQPPATKQGAPPQLPRVTVTDGTIRIVDLKGKQATLAPLTVRGAPDGPLVWNLDVTEADRLKISAVVAPGSDWSHQAKVEVRNLGPLVKPLLDNPSPSTVQTLEQFKLTGRWSGRAGEAVSGRLDLAELTTGGATLTGPVGLSFADGVTTISPEGLVVTPPKQDGVASVPPARAGSGAIVVDGRTVNIKDLALGFAGGEVRIGGSYALSGGQGKVEAWWNRLSFPEGTSHGGTLVASLSQPWPNQPVISVNLTSRGRVVEEGVSYADSDRWESQIEVNGRGWAWDQINWRMAAPKLTYRRDKQEYNLDGVNAQLAQRGQVVTMENLAVPPGNLYGPWKRGTLAGLGQYDLSTGSWYGYVAGANWPISPDAKTPADFHVNAYGDRQWAHLQELYLTAGGLQVNAAGSASYGARRIPVDLHVFTTSPPIDYTYREQGAPETEALRVSGRLYSELHVTGPATGPMNLDVSSKLFARDFKAKGRAVGDVVLRLTGRATDDALTLDTDRLKLFSGEWDIAARYQWRDRLTKVTVSLAEISLAQLDNFVASPPNLRGTFQGRWRVNLPEFDLQRMTVEGEYQARNLGVFKPPPPTTSPAVAASIDKGPAALANLNAPAAPNDGSARPASSVQGPAPRSIPGPRPDARTSQQRAAATATAATTVAAEVAATQRASILPIADRLDGKVSAGNGVVTFDPIKLRRRDGEADLKVSFPVNAPRQVRLEMNTAAWPVDFTDGQDRPSNLLVWLQTKLDVDLKEAGARGPLTLRTVVSAQDRTLATVTAEAVIDRRRLDLTSITGQGLGGNISGEGYLYLDQPFQSAGRVHWQDIDAAAVTELLPAAKGLAGRYSGEIRFAPTNRQDDPDATGPFKVSGALGSADGTWNGMQLGNASFLVYGDQNRAVLNRLNWNVAGGEINGWGRFTQRDDGEKFAHLNFDFGNLDLDQLTRAGRPAGQEHKPTPGRIAGRVIAAGNPFTDEGRKSASGEANVRLTDSDLINIDAVNLLYTVLSVKYGQTQPTGRGWATARLEGERLEIPTVRYMNRGVDVWANAAVVNLFQGAKSPIEGTAAGSARPLKDLKLPFMADVDAVFKALQGGLATVSLEGTVGEPTPRVIPFAAASGAFRRFMLGEVKNEVRGTAGR